MLKLRDFPRHLPLVLAFVVLVSCSTSREVRRRDSTGSTGTAPSGIVLPVRGVAPDQLTPNFGVARDGGSRRHEGLDIMAPQGREVLAATNGIIRSLKWNKLGGNTITITGEDGGKYYYAHLDAYSEDIGEGDAVSAGDVIGYVGATGNAKTPHLHFEIHPEGGGAIDPLPILRGASTSLPAVDPETLKSQEERYTRP